MGYGWDEERVQRGPYKRAVPVLRNQDCFLAVSPGVRQTGDH